MGAAPDYSSFSGGVSVGTLPEFGERLNALRAKFGRNVSFPMQGTAEAVGRLLAKIAHAYAVAELGLGSFKPYLLGIIRGHDTSLLHHFVGSAIGDGSASDDLHDISLVPSDKFGQNNLIVVRIHLFSNYKGMAVHYVVAGERS